MNPLGTIPALALAAISGLIATKVQLLPDVVDVTFILTMSGLGGLAFTLYGVARGYHRDRVGRLTMFGTLVGALFGLAVLVVGLLNA